MEEKYSKFIGIGQEGIETLNAFKNKLEKNFSFEEINLKQDVDKDYVRALLDGIEVLVLTYNSEDKKVRDIVKAISFMAVERRVLCIGLDSSLKENKDEMGVDQEIKINKYNFEKIQDLLNIVVESIDENVFLAIDLTDLRDIFPLRSQMGIMLQDSFIFSGTILDNIRYGRLDATDDEVIEAAKMASADGFIQRLSDGYNTVIEGDGANLSQGQRQLLNIARAALSKAPILVLDEATSSVDTRTERLIEKGMDHLMENRTTFVIAHRLSTVRNANAIMVLENGEIIERGDHDDLLAMKGRYYELYTGKKELS